LLAARRFPPHWSVEETNACFIVRDHNGQALAYVYYEDEPGRRGAAHLLTRDEARGASPPTSPLSEMLRRTDEARRPSPAAPAVAAGALS
jgi:hypothetical protein